MFSAGMVLIPMVVVLSLFKGQLGTLIFLVPLAGGAVGLLSAYILTSKVAGKSLSRRIVALAQAGILIGVASEVGVYLYTEPALEPTILYWSPPVLGAVLLLVVSAIQTANKAQQSPG